MTSDPPAWIWLLAAAGLVVAVALGLARSERAPWGDESTYLAMTASLVEDGDLVFDERDRARVAPRAVILQRAADGTVSYSKPAVFPLLAAPLYAALGPRGMVALNLLAGAAALWLAWRFLLRLGSKRHAALTLATFAVCSVLPFYLGWKMSDALRVAFCLAGLVLAVGPPEGAGRRPLAAAAAGGLLLGLVAAMRYPGGALAAAAVLAALAGGRRRRAVVVALAVVVGLVAASGAGLWLTGSANPYKAARASFNGDTGYPVTGSPAGEAAAERFETHSATQSAGWRPRRELSISAYSALYFWVGRHTGLLVYFPAALVLLATAVARPTRAGLALLAGPAAIAAFYLLWLPENYFGGATFIGNRYFLTGYAALLVALPRLPAPRWLAAAWVVGLVTGGSALLSIEATRGRDAGSQAHAAAGLFRGLPTETTARVVDGFRPRFWSRDFVRFVDAWPRVGGDGFTLEDGLPGADLELAFRLPRSRLVLLATPASPPAELRWRSGWRSGAVALGGGPQVVELELAPAWRWHRYWWRARDRYQVRQLRLAAAGGEVELRYLGDGQPALVPLAPQLESLAVTEPLPAGGTVRVELAVRNAGGGAWLADDVAPVFIDVELLPLAGGGSAGSQRLALPGPVRAGERLALAFDLACPDEPGDYRLALTVRRPPLVALDASLAERRVTVVRRPPPAAPRATPGRG